MATKLRRSIFIGLGGTGMKTILKTKSVLLDNYGQDGELPPLFAFIGIDTDSNEYELPTKSKKNDALTLSARERFSISVNNPKAYFENSKREMRWMPHQNQVFINTLNRGAGQIRSNGRLAFMYNRERLKERLRNALTDVRSSESYSEKWRNYQALESGADGNACTEIHVVFSLSGGTGCGTFLDVAYLLREVARETNSDITINGYGVMPGVFLSEIKDPSAKSRVQPNAYGALRDLDYLMSLQTDERFVKVSWQTQETGELPFDSFVLIDNKNTEGICYKKMSDLTEMLSLALLATTGQIGSNVKSVGDNVKNDIVNKAFDVKNKVAWVSAIGTASVVYNSEHVAKVYELKAQNKLISEILTHVEDKNVIANNWIDNVRVRENEGKDQVIDRLFDITQITSPSLTEKDFDKRTVEAKITNKMDLYNQGFQPTPEEWNKKVDDFYAEVAAKLVEKEKELCKKSLGLANDFLNEVKRQICDIFIGMMRSELVEQEDDRKNAEADFKSQIEQLKSYLNHGLFHGKTENYLSLIKSYAQNYLTADIEAKRRSYAIQFYAKLVELIDKESGNVQETIKKLNSIIEDNDVMIRDLQNHYGNSQNVIIDLAEDIIKNVEVLKDDNILVSSFVDRMPGKTLYAPATKETYKAILDDYTANMVECEALRSQTIDDILNDMSKEKFEEVMRRAANHSLPFLNIDNHGLFTNSTPSHPVGEVETFYICVPDVRTNRLTQSEYFRTIFKSETAEAIGTGLNDRIIIYRQKRPIPALAIGGLDTLKIPYENEQERVSFHIDEELQKRMDEEEYSFQPKNQNQDEAIDAWVMGCILGFIKFDKGNYWYQDFTDESLGNEKENWKSTGSAYRETAFEQFSSNEQLIKLYMDKFHTHIDDIGNLQASELEKDVKDNYFRKYSRCQVTLKRLESSKEYIDTLRLIKKENEHRTSIFKN